MGSVVKRGDKYYARARVMHNYILKTKSKTFASQAEAWTWVDRTEKELRFGEKEEVDHTKKFKDALIRYRDEVSPTKKGKRWETVKINSYLKQDYCPIHYPLIKLTPKVIVEWRDKRPVSNSSKNRELALFSAIFEKCINEWQWMETNPIKSLKGLKEPPPRNRRISDQEIELILENLGFKEDETPKTQKEIIAVIFLIAIETAMRQGEITGLDWSTVYLQQQFVRLPDTKNGDPREVPLTIRAIELFELMPKKRSGLVFDITAETVSTMFRRAVRECAIKDLTFHDARHEACTRLARKIEMLDLAKMTGHRDPRSLMIYYNPTATEIANRLG